VGPQPKRYLLGLPPEGYGHCLCLSLSLSTEIWLARACKQVFQREAHALRPAPSPRPSADSQDLLDIFVDRSTLTDRGFQSGWPRAQDSGSGAGPGGKDPAPASVLVAWDRRASAPGGFPVGGVRSGEAVCDHPEWWCLDSALAL